MSDGSSSVPPDPLRAWLEATGGTEGRPGGDPEREHPAPSRRLLALTAAVCAVALALGGAVLSGRGGRASPAVAAPSTAPPPALPPGPTPAAPAAVARHVDEPAEALAQASAQGTPAAAAAVLAVRSSVTGDRYVDTAVAVAVDGRAGFAIVTVDAWVLHRDGRTWDAGAPRRYAVAVGEGSAGAVALAPPWLLPAPGSAAPKRSWAPLDDTAVAAAAGDALRSAGYRDVRDLDLRTDARLPQILSARMTAAGPGDTTARPHEVWLSADAATVLGLVAAPDLPPPGAQP